MSVREWPPNLERDSYRVTSHLPERCNNHAAESPLIPDPTMAMLNFLPSILADAAIAMAFRFVEAICLSGLLFDEFVHSVVPSMREEECVSISLFVCAYLCVRVRACVFVCVVSVRVSTLVHGI